MDSQLGSTVVPPREGRKRSNAKGQETRERILIAASRLMADYGYAAASISRVSAEAKVQTASLYWAFESKEVLFREALNWSFANWIKRVKVNWKPSGLGELRASLETLAGSFVTEPDFVRLMMLAVTEHRHGDHEIMDAARKIRVAGRDQFTALILSALPREIGHDHAMALAQSASIWGQQLMDGFFLSVHFEPELLDPETRVRTFAATIIRDIEHSLNTWMS